VVRILKDLDEAVESRHVLVVEDVMDRVMTLRLSYLLENLRLAPRGLRPGLHAAFQARPAGDRRAGGLPGLYRGRGVRGRLRAGLQRQVPSLPYIGVLKPRFTAAAKRSAAPPLLCRSLVVCLRGLRGIMERFPLNFPRLVRASPASLTSGFHFFLMRSA
jgi:hypothetical protein